MKLNIKIEDFNPALTPCLNTDCDRWDDDGCIHIRKAGKNHQRNKVETVFFIMKRKFGESLKGRKYRLQIKEIKSM